MSKNNSKTSNLIKLIITNTIVFIFITIFASLFKLIFGDGNVLIAISTFIAMLMYLERDLTTNFFKNLFIFIFMNLGMGIVVFISCHNMWIGIPLNLIMFFIVGYITCSELRKPVYVPFILQFCFLYNTPVPDSQEWLRLLALIAGAFIIMIPQLLFNRNRIAKNSVKMFSGLNQLLKQKSIFICEDKDYSSLDQQIDGILRGLKFLIFGSREKKFYVSKDGEASLNLLAGLEKLNISLTSISKEEFKKYNLSSFINNYLDSLNKVLIKEMKIKEFELLNNEFIENNKDFLYNTKSGLGLLNSFFLVLDSLIKSKAKKFVLKEDLKKLPDRVRFFTEFKKETKNSLGFSYAVRVSLGMAITCFIIQIFKIPIDQGIWLMFTIYSIVNPIYETAKYKTKDRIISTFLGAIVIIILLSIFKEGSQRTIILLILGYIMCYLKQYKTQIFFATMVVVTVATGTEPVTQFALSRILMVLAGLVIAITLNKFVLKCDLNKLNQRLKSKYANAISNMFYEIKFSAETKTAQGTKVKNFFLLCANIDKAIRDNYIVTKKDFKEEIHPHSNILVADLFTFYINLEKRITDKEYTEYVSHLMESFSLPTAQTLLENEFTKVINNNDSLSKKLACSELLEIYSISNCLETKKA
ncbi:MAG: FUSC family protein [Sarcina sp.]